MVITFIAAAVLGIFIGMLSGLLGIGGGTVMVPMFRLAFGMSAMASTATSLFTIIPTSISGVVSHMRNGTCAPRIGLAMGVGGACTSSLGVWLASMSPSWAVMVAAALVIGYSAFGMFRKARKARKAPQGGAPRARAARVAVPDAPEPPEPPEPTASPSRGPSAITRRQLAMGFAIGLIAGVMSGYVGVGGGFIMVPLLLNWVGLPMRQASGTSLIGVMILAMPAAVSQGLLGNIDYLVGIVTAIGTIPGAFFGARLITRVPERILRILFAAFLGVGAVLLVARELALFV